MTITKILIGIDDSTFAEHAAEYGFDLARKFNAAVGLVNIVEPITISQTSGIDPIMPDMMLGAPEELEILDIQKKQSENIVDRTIAKFGAGLQVTHFNEYGATAEGIITCSKEFNADLIVIGTHKRSGLERLLEGSVAEHVVRHAEVPVLVVPFAS